MLSFAGDLEHLPIVDVMQLLHQTRKSGILTVKGRKGESQLVFKGGYMVSANHLNNSIRIGKILVDLNIITPGILDQALHIQGSAGAWRKPLIVTLIDQGLVNEEDAYKGLEHLIEMAVVEILTWKKGSFTLEVLPTCAADNYRFYPGKLAGEINVDTQSVLMDALRIFDEKMRDGELTDEELSEDELFAKGGSAAMRIECPECHLAGKINELEISPEGRRVTCPRCKNTFHVDKPAAVWSPDMMNICPVCQYSTFGTEMFAVCPQCGLVGSEYQAKLRKQQELEREQQQARHDEELLLRSLRNPDLTQAPDDAEKSLAPLPVRYTGWACIALGGALLFYGLYGLLSYYGKDWQAVLSEDMLEPLSKTEVFFRLGFLPWLFTLFSAVFLTTAFQFLLLRDRARKDMEKAAWACVVLCAVYEIAEFISWMRISSTSPPLAYYAVGIMSSLLMIALWSIPFLALFWFLRSETITREFPQ